ncbi:chemotaxis protein CheD [Halomarina salina]|uniref:Probable chemoreceptor glutamine deamidase CheD n=1 Tax=Halomarina salina TaxID=1872699 RepID=A0ABD5RKT4_9EURY
MKTYSSSAEEAPGPDRILVGVSNYVVGESEQTLVAYGLGACVSVVLYDESEGVGGLTHAMLPNQPADSGNPGKYVDAAVEALLRDMIAAGSGLGDIEAYVVGGATIFELRDLATGAGERNVEAARDQLDSLDVPVVAEAVGGDVGRTVELDLTTGRVTVSTADGETEEL